MLALHQAIFEQFHCAALVIRSGKLLEENQHSRDIGAYKVLKKAKFVQGTHSIGDTSYKIRRSDLQLEDGEAQLWTLDDVTIEALEHKRLVESERNLFQMINLVPHAIFLKDNERRFMVINQAVAAHHGLEISEMLGKRDEDFFSAEDSQPFIEDEQRILNTKEPLYIPDESFRLDNGKVKYMETIKVPFYIESKQEWGILGVAIDVTRRKELQEEKTNLKLNHQKNLMNAVVEAQERERKSIAEDLHDGLGQILTAANMNLLTHKKHISQTQLDHLNKSISFIQDAIQEVRNITSNLVPGVLRDFGLSEALEKLCDRCSGISDTHFYYSAHVISDRFDKLLEVSLYRITQEIANNALKHAGAQTVDIQLFQRENELVYSVEDDGNGFDLKSAIKSNKGLGLKSIQNRVDLLNGTLDIDTSPGRGCSYSIILDLSKF